MITIEKGDLVLTAGRDHSYEPVRIVRKTVVYNSHYGTWYEDSGISPLDKDEEIMSAWVVE